METFLGRPPRNPPQHPKKAWESAQPLPGVQPGPFGNEGRRPVRPLGSGSPAVLRGCLITMVLGYLALCVVGFLLAAGPPPAVIMLYGVIGAVSGWRNIGSLLRDRRLKAAGKDAGRHPWLFDRRWDRAGARDSAWRAYLPAGGVVVACFLAWWQGRSMVAGPYEDLIIPLYVACAGWAGYTLYKCHRRAGLGDTFVCWDEFPFFVGGPVDLTFGVASSGGVFESVRFALRCVHEIDIRTCVLHEQTYELKPNQSLPAPDTFTEVHFDVAPDAWGTILDPQVTVSWELLVEGETSQGPYKWWFPLPVYRRPEGEASPSQTRR
jgi:hypothetical protein